MNNLKKLNTPIRSTPNSGSTNKRGTPGQKFNDSYAISVEQDNLLNSWVRQQGSVLPRIDVNKRVSSLNQLNSAGLPPHAPQSPMKKPFVTTVNSSNSNSRKEITKVAYVPNSFYLECINEVDRINRPDKIYYDDPKELIYVRNLPNFKFITFGNGKLINSMWQIRNIYDKPNDDDDYSLFDHLSIKDKI